MNNSIDMKNIPKPLCDMCPLKETHGEPVTVFENNKPKYYTKNRPVLFNGGHNAKLIIMGEAPGSWEIHRGKPFVGPTGKDIADIISKTGYNKPIFLMNAVCCRIPKGSSQKIQNEAIKSCKPFVMGLLKTVQPEMILSLGSIALKQLLGKGKITNDRGKIVKSDIYNCLISPTFHPAYCMRNPGMKPLMVGDINNAIKELELLKRDENIQYNYKDSKDLSELLKLKNKIVAVDSETQGLDNTNPNSVVISFSFSWESGQGINVWLTKECSENEKPDFTINDPNRGLIPIKKVPNYNEIISQIKEFCIRDDLKKIMFNGAYDLRRLRQIGVRKINGYILDVQQGMHVINPDAHKDCHLADAIRLYTDMRSHKEDFKSKVDMSDMLGASKNDPIAHTQYSCADTDGTLRAGLTLIKKFKEDKITGNYYKNLVHPGSIALMLMTNNGVYLDLEKAREAEEKVNKYLEEKKKKALKYVPKNIKEKYQDNLSLTRTDLIRDTLFDKEGYNISPLIDKDAKTPSGALSVNKNVLKRIATEKKVRKPALEFIKAYLEWSPFQKLVSTYIKGYQKQIRYDGKLHPTISTHFTVTGRTGSRHPNLQNIPKRNKEVSSVIRSLFTASEGRIFLAIDYSQSELRWIAHRSGDDAFSSVFQNHGDIHTETAKKILERQGNNNPTKEDMKAARTKAKAVNFGFIYGMHEKGFQLAAANDYNLFLSLEECSVYRNEIFFSKYPGLLEWHRKEVEYAKKHGFVRSCFGRKREFPGVYSSDFLVRSDAERQLINFVIQVDSSDGLIHALIRGYREGIFDKDFYPVLSIHDELIFEVTDNKEIVMNKYNQMENIMCNMDTEPFGFTLSVPFAIDGNIGYNLAEMKEYQEYIGE